MDPITIGALIYGGSQLIGAIISLVGEAQAQDLMRKAQERYGELNPETMKQIVAEELGPSALAQVEADARLKEAQFSALERLRQFEEGGGFDARDVANLHRVQNEAARADSANRSNILEGMQARGVAGSGAELAMQLQSAQAAADRQHQGALDTAAQARQRYFESILSRAGLAGQMRGQQFAEDSQAARAKDARDQLNWGRRFEVDKYNNAVSQNNFDNRLGITDRQAGFDQRQAQDTRRTYDRIGQGVADAGRVGASAVTGMPTSKSGVPSLTNGEETFRWDEDDD